MNDLDLRLFLALNAGVGFDGWKLALTEGVAIDLVWVLPAVVVLLWTRGPAEMRAPLALAGLATLLAVAVAVIAGALWYVPPPAVAHLGHAYLGRPSGSSFPGDYVTILAAVAFAVLAAPRNGWTGLVLLAVALLVGWARVFLGAQYPFDILGGFAIALGANLALVPARAAVKTRLTPRVERWYRRLCARPIAAGYFKR